MKSNEWYTPAKYIEAAREVMGRIDLDPASCEEANKTVRAERYYSKEDNGLMQPWYGCVWLNPPYGRIHFEDTGSTRSYQLLFAQRAYRMYHTGIIEQAVLLLHGVSLFGQWFKPLWFHPICMHDTKLFFLREGKEVQHGFGTIFVYLGPHEARFIDIFSRFGTVARRVSVPKVVPYMEELFT